VFRTYVLSLLLVGLLRKFEAYLVYLTLLFEVNSLGAIHFSYMFPCFPARISDMRNRFSALSNVTRNNEFKCHYCTMELHFTTTLSMLPAHYHHHFQENAQYY